MSTTAALLVAWTARVGVPLPASAHVQPSPDGQSLALVDVGLGLVLSAETGPDAALSALNAQLSPFVEAGLTAETPTTVPCVLAGVPAACLSSTVTVAPGAVLHVLAGALPGTDWAAACLDRGKDPLPLCGTVIRAQTPTVR